MKLSGYGLEGVGHGPNKVWTWNPEYKKEGGHNGGLERRKINIIYLMVKKSIMFIYIYV
jgi:hypothetical protein